MLNSIEDMKKIDPDEMYNKIYNFPEQLIKAAQIGSKIQIDTDKFSNIKNIVVAGMGGSAIGGDTVRTYLAGKLEVPFVVCRHYSLPGFVNENTLVVISSYSGNTEETLAALNDALAKKAKIVCFSTGGKVGQIAKTNKLPLIQLPDGYPPRTALGYSFIPLLFLMAKLGFIDDVSEEIPTLIAGLKNYRELYAAEVESDNNRAKAIAEKIYGKIPIIYSGPELTDTVGTRWKGQICENAKCLAYNSQFAEFNHNELVGWNIIKSYRDKLVVIYLRTIDDHVQISERMSIVKDIISKQNVEVVEVLAQGENSLLRIFSLIQIGDFISYYLAIINKIDPTPVKVIDFLKHELEKKK
ncbi:MAG: bifunctional phosphoglucose/phosphomannose isomerase [Candidatus Zixiibacteriota bacterium]|nr:MAG: bifunctional phosphoglucose/phosphomannose isomerase [candidate division Zixibacteria bacterium]